MKKTWITVVACCFVLVCACGTKAKQEPPVSTTEIPKATVTIAPTSTSTPVPTSTPAPTATDIPTPTPTVAPPKSSLDILRETLVAENSLCGVAFLSYFEGEYAEVMAEWEKNGTAEKYPFLSEITEEQTVLTGGGEWFLLVPAADDVKVSVYECNIEFEKALLVPGKELYSSNTGAPILIRGNVSDLYPSTVVVLEKADLRIEYSPYLSLKDGSLAEGEGIVNIGE